MSIMKNGLESDSMEITNIKIRDDLCEKINVEIKQSYCDIRNDDLHIYSAIIGEKNSIEKGCFVTVKANIYDADGKLLLTICSHSKVKFEKTEYVTFSFFYGDISRFLDVEKIDCIELYPVVVNKELRKLFIYEV